MPGYVGTSVGDVNYIAPEVPSGKYDQQADIYGLGGVMSWFPAPPNSNWGNLQRRCLSPNPSNRPFAYQIRDEAVAALEALRVERSIRS